MHLVCSRSTVLEIQAADFGESAALICGKNEESNQLCRLSEKTGIVKTRCDGKPQCYISALRSIFGDPCLGLDKQTDTSIYLNVMYACVKATNSGKSTEITPTQPSTSVSIAGDNATISTSFNTTVNTTQQVSTTPTKKTVPKVRSEEDGPNTQKKIPVFDPAKSVDLDAISGTASGMSSPAVGFLIWFCIVGVISN